MLEEMTETVTPAAETLQGFELSPQQRHLWTLLHDGAGASGLADSPYRARAIVAIEGDVESARLREALDRVVRRHEILRMGFHRLPGMTTPLQVPREAGFSWRALDGGGCERERIAALWEQPAGAAETPLSASWAPLSAERSLLLLNLPALCCDARGLDLLVDEVSRAYAGQYEAPAEEVGYVDLAAWQNELLLSPDTEKERLHWLLQAPAATESPRLPFEGRARGGGFSPRTLSLLADDGLGMRVETAAAACGVPASIVLLACWKILLWRLTGGGRIVVGVAHDGRNYEELATCPGLFVKHLPIVSELEPGFRFSELVLRLHAASETAAEMQQFFSWDLLEGVGGHRFPAFCFELTGDPEPTEPVAPRFSVMHRRVLAERFVVKLACRQGGGAGAGLVLELQYDASRLDATAAGRMAAQLEEILVRALSTPGDPISELPALAVHERHDLLYERNDTRIELGAGFGLHELVARQARETPGEVAAELEGKSLTYSELVERAWRLSRRLRIMGVGPDVPVAVCLDRSLDMLVALLGVLGAGGAYVPLDPAYPRERLELMIEDSGAPLLLTHQALAVSLPEQAARVVCLDAADGEVQDEVEDGRVPVAVSPQNLAYVIYTSGSTGRPKGVMISHGAINNRLLWMCRRFGLSGGERVLQKTSFSFDASLWELFMPLLRGSTVVLARPGGQQDSAYLAKAVAGERITILQLVPSMLRIFLEEPGLSGCRSLRRVFCGGEVLPAELRDRLLARLDAQLVNLYGPTEVAIDATSWVCPPGEAVVPVGTPLDNVEVYLLDGGLEPVPSGAVGEIYVGGAGLARGYLGQPERTAERFVPSPFGQPGSRLYRTGDLGRHLADRGIEFLGRADHQVKVRGFRIELGEIEAALGAHPAVRQAVVTAREDSPGDQRLVAYVVTADPGEAASAELRRWLAERLPEHMIPAAFVRIDRLPLLPNGKLDRGALPAAGTERSEGEYAPPRTPTEEMLAAIWGELLGVERAGARDSFFELGGHSLLATQLVSRLRQSMGVEVGLRAIFETPVLAALAWRIDQLRRGDYLPEAPPLVPVPRDGALPLSFAQQRLWLLDRLDPWSAAYNLPLSLWLSGWLRVPLLEHSLSEIVRRHESLRTVFVEIDGEPVQKVLPHRPCSLPVVDLEALPEERRQTVALSLAWAEAQRPFDLSRGPLLRACLVRLEEREHLALATMHHIVSDAWSTGILIRELSTLYQSLADRTAPALPELPVQYADFAVWQRGWLQGEVLKEQLAYWRGQLGGDLPVLQLPTDRPRPPVQTVRGAVLTARLPLALTEDLERLSRAEGTTLFMTLLAGFQALLGRYSGQRDVIVGSPIANRTRLEVESLIGFFVNTLALRGDLGEEGTFRDLLSRTREAVLGASAHQDLPFEKLVEELQPRRDLSRSPLFDVLFVLQNAPAERLALSGLMLRPLGVDSGRSPFDWTVSMTRTDQGLATSFEYNRDLFDRGTVTRALVHLESLLEAWAADPGAGLWETPLLSPAEEHQVRVEWNRLGESFPEVSLPDLVAAQVQSRPDASAAVFENQVWSYAGLDRQAERVARRLTAAGVGAGDLVGIFAERSLEMLAALLGVLRLGAAYVPLDPGQPRERLELMLEEAGLVAVLALGDVTASLPGTAPRVIQWNGDGEERNARREGVGQRSDGDAPAYVIYTSGSTGRPKGVQVTHRALVNFLWSMKEEPGLRAEDVWLSVTPLSFDIAGLELYLPLIVGGRVVLASRETAMDGRRLLALLRDSEATVLQATPASWRLLLAADWEGTPGLTALCGGEALPRRLAADLCERVGALWNVYGPTETTIWSTLARVEPEEGPISIGRPLANTQVHLLDTDWRPVPVGAAGELCIGGTGLAVGYLRRPDLTAERFIPDPLGPVPGARLYRTGDLARFWSDGRLEYLGRQDHQIKLRGFRIELEEIEAVLGRHPLLRQVVVRPRQDATGEPRLVAWIVAAEGIAAPSASDLRVYLHDKLPEPMVPAAFVALDALPLTPNGKVDTKALPEPDAKRLLGAAPRDLLELKLLEIWKGLFSQAEIGITDDFFELGGHSLLGVRLMALIRRRFERELPLATLFKHPTVGGLAGVLRRQASDAPWSPLVTIQPSGSGAPFFCVHPIGGQVLCYAGLARHLGTGRPFYGIQAPPLEQDAGFLHTTVEGMAAAYIDVLRSVQETGPYLIGGASFGGLVAYEMAQQLVRQGEEVALLALLDTIRPVHNRRITESDYAAELAGLVREYASERGRDDLSFSAQDLLPLDREGQLQLILETLRAFDLLPAEIDLDWLRRFVDGHLSRLEARLSYEPAPYPGRITLFKARDQDSRYLEELSIDARADVLEPTLGWSALCAGRVDVLQVPGYHANIFLEPHVRVLARELGRTIDETLGAGASVTAPASTLAGSVLDKES